ncbi:MAG: ATP-binding protein [Dokdonella sp.]
MANRPPRWNYEARIFAGVVLVALPGLLTAALTLWFTLDDHRVAVAIWAALAVLTVGLAFAVRSRAVYPLYTLSNLLEALREGDYSLRGSHAVRGDAIGEVVLEVNALAQTLREQRLAVEEKSALLGKVIAALDSAVVSFDSEGRLALANPSAERLLAQPLATLYGKSARSLGLEHFLLEGDGDRGGVIEHHFAGASGRWEIRHARFREEGRPHDLLVISDLSRALREEERLAWQRLLRVLGHELNNSLAPIRSMADTLGTLIRRDSAEEHRDDLLGGLHVIGNRAEALARFMGRYTQLARLPPPTPRELDFAVLAHRVARLEQRLEVSVAGPEPVPMHADADQIEQALINLLQNAVDAALEGGGHVTLAWSVHDEHLLVDIQDDGLGLAPSENLFVPFFTTKPGGSGIGLVLAQQIIEAHGGTLSLQNRNDTQGCVAQLQLPL